MSAQAPKWKPDSSKPRPIPAQFKDYIARKQKDFLGSMFFGAVVGVAMSGAVLHFHAGMPLTPEMVGQMMLYSGSLTLAITLLSRYSM